MRALNTLLEICWWMVPLSAGVLCFLVSVKRKASLDPWKEHRCGRSALELLDRRYVSGEIGAVEYGEKILTMGLENRR